MICEGSCDTEDLTLGVYVFICSHGCILVYTYLCVSMAFDFPSMLRVILLLFNVFFSPLLNFTGLPTPISSQSGAGGFLQKPNTCCLFGLHNSMRRHRQTCGTSYLSPSHPDLFPPSSLINLCLLFHLIHL